MSKDEYAGLPAQVRKEAEEADRMQAEMSGAGKTPGTPDDVQAPDGAAPVNANENPDGFGQNVKGTPEKTPAPADDFEQKYKVLRGKYDKEVPELNVKVRGMHVENTELRDRNAALEQALSARSQDNSNQNSGDQSSESGNPGLNPGDFAEYGQEFVQMAEENKTLRNDLNAMKGQVKAVAETSQKTAKKEFTSNLTGLKADWAAIDADPAFDNWLYETGKKENYTSAASQNNAQEIVDIMDLYLARTGKTYGKKPPASRSDDPAPIPANVPDIESQVAPDTTGSAQGSGEEEQQTYWKAADVSLFFDKYALQSYPFQVGELVVNNPEEAARIDNDITRANKENRIIG